MKKTVIFAAAGFGLVAAVSATAPRADGDPSVAWNRKAAAAYLDQRATWWTTWPNAQRDHGTFCVSCHTALPYALARPELRGVLHESDVSATEQKLFGDVVTRVRGWNEMKPFYGEVNMGNSVYSTPIVADNVLYIANRTHLFAIENGVKPVEANPVPEPPKAGAAKTKSAD